MKMNRITYWIAGLLVAVIGWSWTANYSKLCEIEKSLVELKIEVSRMQVEVIDRAEIKAMINDELAKHGIK